MTPVVVMFLVAILIIPGNEIKVKQLECKNNIVPNLCESGDYSCYTKELEKCKD